MFSVWGSLGMTTVSVTKNGKTKYEKKKKEKH